MSGDAPIQDGAYYNPRPRSYHMHDIACELIQDELAGFAGAEEMRFELVCTPYPDPMDPTQRSMRIGGYFILMMKTPLLDRSMFYVANMVPDYAIFLHADNVKQIVRDHVEMLRSQKAEWLKGNG